MNYKKKEFLISISIIFTLTLIIILYLNYFFISLFGLNQENFIFIIIPLLLLALGIFLSFTSNILKPIFKSDDKLQQNIKETIHELNIPTSTIKMNIQLLKKNIKDEKNLNRLLRIEQANNNLLKLYENMEYEIKKEIGKIDKEKFYLDEIIYKCLEKIKDIKKDTKIDINISKIQLYTDINGFEKVIDNLLINAIKYNNKENAYISISFKNNILSFYNKGKEIDTKNLFILFDKYFQENEKKDGFGLGLFIVKEFCDRQKIHINIDTLKKANRFNLNLKNIIVK